jgi:transposase
MSKSSLIFDKVFCGIDVSAETLAVAVLVPDQPWTEREFPNTAKGHQALIGWLARLGACARVGLESTGNYSMDLALALAAAKGIEVAVLNPKDVHRFAGTLRRSKTDSADARALAEYSLRMPFTAWRVPSPAQLRLRSLSRYLHALSEERTRTKNRLHAARGSSITPRAVLEDLNRELKRITQRLLQLRRQAMLLVRADADLSHRHDLLTTIPGIGSISAVQLLGELTLLTPAMTVRQWVAHSGLDPAHQTSGTSVHKPSRISRHGNRHLRRALFMPALVAARHDPHLAAFYQALLQRHKAKMQALIAVARKLLHTIYGVLKTSTPYQGAKLFPNIQLITS